MNIQAILLDCDGLMFNTEEISQNMWRDIARDFHVEIPDAFFQKITGAGKGTDLTSFYETIPHLKEIHQIAHQKRFDLEFWKSFSPDAINKKGLTELLQYLDTNHISWAICSSSHRTYVETLLNTMTYHVTSPIIIGGDMVTNGKPDPEIFLLGAKTLHVKPENCLVLEDSKQGIHAANRAHMHSCFIQDTIIPDEEMKQWIEFTKQDLSQVIPLLKQYHSILK